MTCVYQRMVCPSNPYAEMTARSCHKGHDGPWQLSNQGLSIAIFFGKMQVWPPCLVLAVTSSRAGQIPDPQHKCNKCCLQEPPAQAAMVGAIDFNEQLDQQPAAAGPAGQAKASSSSEMQQELDEPVEPTLTEQQSQVLGSHSAAFQPLVDQPCCADRMEFRAKIMQQYGMVIIVRIMNVQTTVLHLAVCGLGKSVANVISTVF